MSRTLLLPLLLLVPVVLASAQYKPISASAPYTEIVSTRVTDEKAEKVAEWPQLCLSNITRVSLFASSSSSSSYVAFVHSATSAALVRLSTPARESSNGKMGSAAVDCVEVEDVKGIEWARAAVAPFALTDKGDTGELGDMLVAAPTGLFWLVCNLAEGKVS